MLTNVLAISLKTARENARLTQLELSSRANVSLELISQIENGRRMIGLASFVRVVRIAKALDLQPSDLVSPRDVTRLGLAPQRRERSVA